MEKAMLHHVTSWSTLSCFGVVIILILQWELSAAVVGVPTAEMSIGACEKEDKVFKSKILMDAIEKIASSISDLSQRIGRLNSTGIYMYIMDIA